MPSSFKPRRAYVAAALSVALGASAAPAAAQSLPIEVPCVPGVSCAGDGQPTPDATPRCANAGIVPARGNLRKVRRATLCLLNQQRRKHGVRKLRANRPLRVVATRYARDMIRRSFFAHVSPTGSTFVQRIKRSPYLDNANDYDVGENLAWGAGQQSTPRDIVRSWMASPTHRANVLNGSFRDVGVGVRRGVPVPGLAGGATYVNEFGRRA